MDDEKRIKRSGIFDIDLHRNYLYFRRTKIIATIGPSSASQKMLGRLISSGMNVARINFSHGKAEDHLKTMENIKKISRSLDRTVAILGDLCGPKIRVGKFKGDGVILKKGAVVSITPKAVLGDENTIPCQYKKIAEDVSVGERIMLDDGNLELKAVKKNKGVVYAKVIHGGPLKNNKGMNLPDTKISAPSLTAKDRKDISYCIKGGVDYIALSFVRKADDIKGLKALLKRKKADIPVIAKIEKPEALTNIEGIVNESDAIMIARGDLGVEMQAKKVPFIQSKLIEACIEYNKPVIVATQMLESMMERPRPTRAEVADVAAACLSGADAVMLSGETASGRYPIEAMRAMDSIVRETEAYQFFSGHGRFRDAVKRGGSVESDALSEAIAQLSRDLMVRCIIVPTKTGSTVAFVASDRPAAPIITMTASEKVLRRLQLVWGVLPMHVKGKITAERGLKIAGAFLKKLRLAGCGDNALVVAKISGKESEIISIGVHRLL